MEALMEKLCVKPSQARTTFIDYSGVKVSHQTWCGSHTQTVVDGDGTVLHLELVPLLPGAYYITAVEDIKAAPEGERDCISLPVRCGFVKIGAGEEVYSAVSDGMRCDISEHMWTEREGQYWDNPIYSDFGKRVFQLRGDEIAAADLSVGDGDDDSDVLAAYFLYHPHKSVDFFTSKRQRNGEEKIMASLVPAAMCGFTQMMKLGYYLDFMPQHPYQAQSMCMRDGHIALVGVYPRRVSRSSSTDALQRVWGNQYSVFFEHFFYWRSGEPSLTQVKDVIEDAWAMEDEDAFCAKLFAIFRPQLGPGDVSPVEVLADHDVKRVKTSV
ncbi:hypothetical protein JKP88DRAFT_251620 [Tribonema minus]|uniref:Uncharacterized protein n=1 Tax=Tribonema minus TaxID=303371 RepID=A0A835ZFK7_9STRA|nr:hypothetical protein JKP88DRAFT_251620 [Tribonema minus]